jgi:hypothetical protein
LRRMANALALSVYLLLPDNGVDKTDLLPLTTT